MSDSSTTRRFVAAVALVAVPLAALLLLRYRKVSGTMELPDVYQGENVANCSTDRSESPWLVPGTEGLNRPCVEKAFPACKTQVEFAVEVNAVGLVADLKMPVGLSARQRACLREMVNGFIFFPARSCDGAPHASTYRGGWESICNEVS